MRRLTPRGYRQVVQKEEPLTIEAAGEDNEHKLLEVLGAVHRSKGQTPRQPGSRSCKDRHFLGGLLFVVNLVDTLFEVSYRNEDRARYAGLDMIAVGNEEYLPHCHPVERSVVHYKAPGSPDRLMRR